MLRTIPYPPSRSMMKGDSPAMRSPMGFPQPSTSAAPQAEPARSPAAISKTYQTSSNLFLTRRLPEALAVVHPLVPEVSSAHSKIPRALRVKVWSLYIAILDAASKLGAEEGKNLFGGVEWRKLVARIRDGHTWEEANRCYGGEGKLDVEVVIALATLLLSHAHDQSITQKRIEAYLGAMSLMQEEDPRVFAQRYKLMELYILHVLPRVGDWEYAKEFSQMSPDLDDDQKEAFAAALENLRKEKEQMELHAKELENQREEELEWERLQAEKEARAAQPTPPTPKSPVATKKRASSARPASRMSSRGGGDTPAFDAKAKSSKSTALAKPKRRAASAAGVVSRRTGGGGVSASNSQAATSTNLFSTTTALMNKLQRHIQTTGGSAVLMRTALMIAMFAWMTNNRQVRERIKRFLLVCWVKITRTIGMGMKVTYI